jgi:hypothetical protein
VTSTEYSILFTQPGDYREAIQPFGSELEQFPPVRCASA